MEQHRNSPPSTKFSGVVAPLTPPKERGVDVVADKGTERRLPPTPPGAAASNNTSRSTSGLDRKRSNRPVSYTRSGSGESVRRNGRGVGPKLPIKVSSSDTALKKMSLAEMRNGMRLDDDDTTPGESSDAFEDAAESVRATSKSQSRSNSIQSEHAIDIGLGIHGTNKEDGDAKPKMSARLSVFGNFDPVYNAEPSPPLPSPSQEKKERDEDAPSGGESATPEGSGTPEVEDNERTPVAPQHSRQHTLEGAPSLVRSSVPEQQQDSASGMDSLMQAPEGRQSRSHSRQVTAETAPALVQQTSTSGEDGSSLLSSIRAGLRSTQGTTETVPILSPPVSESDRDRSLSPTKAPTMVRGLSGDLPLGSPPPSSISRVQGLEQRNGPERPGLNSSPSGLMRTASTRMAGFLGRMNSMRKPGRSPPAPRPEGRFAERRNTGHSIASMTSLGGDGLATISDGPEDGSGQRPSLQDQFSNIRRHGEHEFQGPNGPIEDGDSEKTPIARTASDAGVIGMEDHSNEAADDHPHRAYSTPSIIKSPPMNPSLPPGTASGLTAGPAEEPKPVDWDLWQALVYEGPAALRRTDDNELSKAIASGIPAAIRGVVWQVLAESKDADLENVYRSLKARGSAGDVESLAPETARPTPLSRKGSQNNVNEAAEQEDKESEVVSSSASVRSASSTPATSNLASPPLSVQDDSQELKLKLFAEKQKREAAALTKLEKAIKRDLGSRTSFSKFTQAAGLQDGLFGVCKAYALFDEGVGYAQGINFIAMPLLFNMTEEEAFTLLVRLMSKYDIRSIFTGDLSGLHLRLYQFERLLEDHDPALYCHLRRRNVGPQLYATQWFLTLFAYRFPLQLVLRVYDLLFSEGLTAILKFGLVLMQHNRDTLLGMKDMGQLTNFLKEKLFDVYIDKTPSASSLLDSGFFGSVTGGADKELYRADEMVRDACEIKIPEATLAQYTAEWEESQRQTQERESELEHLRTTNITLAAKVKELEERTQLQDSEHVNIAGDLVRVKLENDTISDENEGLRIKVEELQKMLDTQPAEVEARLKQEMDRILQRNTEVQSENRVLKEEMEEIEHELVNAKMQRAQTQSDYDALMQKWANIQNMLSDK